MRYLMGFGLGFAPAVGLWLGKRLAWRQLARPSPMRPPSKPIWRPERIAQAVGALGALKEEARLQPAAACLTALIAQDEGLASLFSETIAEGGGPGRQAKIVCQRFFEHGLLSKACLRHRAQPMGDNGFIV